MWAFFSIHKIRIIIAALTGVIVFVAITIFWDQSVMFRKKTFYHANVSEKVVALTFDDGPSEKWTPLILDELKKAHIHATFFLVGKHVQQYPDIVKRIIAEGHEIGNHTMNHKVLFDLPLADAMKEVRDGEAVIERITGQTPTLFRPPKAWINSKQKKEIQKLGYTIVLWRINTKDWVTFDDKLILNYVDKKDRPGDIILFHDAGGVIKPEGGSRIETVKVIGQLAELLRKKGYRFVTVGELIKMQEAHER
ncbi:MAG: polysaccharide deacetylase family protein [Candidatus Omnitrophica bacterium]|nr:polysaccharide deacetylase family protein [Candidatus Omnitrophota bacterium]